MNEQTPVTRKKFDVSLDLLNIFSCFCVVELHVNEAVHTFSYGRYWLTSMVIQVIFYYGVPLFFMISGATLMNYRDRNTTKDYFKKRFFRTVIPFLFWSLVAVYWHAVYLGNTDIDIHSPKAVFEGIINTKFCSIYWFFIPLFACYLAIPFLSMIPKEKRKEIFLYFMVYSFIANSLIPTVMKVLGISYNSGLKNALDGNGYILLLICGYYFYNYPLVIKWRRLIYLMGAAGVIIMYAGRVILSYKNGEADKIFTGYYNFPSVMAAIAIFVFFKYTDWHWLEKYSGTIRKIAGASFGIYLIHFYYLKDIITKFEIDTKMWQWRIFGAVFIYLSCLIIVLICKKIPGIKKILP